MQISIGRSRTALERARRVPDREQVDLFSGLYRQLLAEERRHPGWKIGMEASTKMLLSTIAAKGMEYEEFMFSA